MRLFSITILSLFAFSSWAQEGTQAAPKTIYQYKKYESFDLGSMDLDGELLAPGDVTVRERDRVKVRMDLFNRKKMGDFKRKDAQSIK